MSMFTYMTHMSTDGQDKNRVRVKENWTEEEKAGKEKQESKEEYCCREGALKLTSSLLPARIYKPCWWGMAGFFIDTHNLCIWNKGSCWVHCRGLIWSGSTQDKEYRRRCMLNITIYDSNVKAHRARCSSCKQREVSFKSQRGVGISNARVPTWYYMDCPAILRCLKSTFVPLWILLQLNPEVSTLRWTELQWGCPAWVTAQQHSTQPCILSLLLTQWLGGMQSSNSAAASFFPHFLGSLNAPTFTQASSHPTSSFDFCLYRLVGLACVLLLWAQAGEAADSCTALQVLLCA